MLAGVLSNQAVLVSNWGKFPVMLNARQESAIEKVDATPTGENRFSILNTSVLVKDLKFAHDPDGMMDDVHCIMSRSNHLKFLADWINFRVYIASPGDELIILGSWLWSFAPLMWFTLILRKVYVQETVDLEKRMW